MVAEAKPAGGTSVEFDGASVERYKTAAKFMVKVADECFGIKLPQPVAQCWENTLELMYYADHILDQLSSPADREKFGKHAIECMFADPLDWEYLNFGEPNIDRALGEFRRSFINLTAISENTADATLELFGHTEALKETLTIKKIADARTAEGQKCAEVLLGIGNDLAKEMGGKRYKEWFSKFWKFGNLADLFIDFGDDVEDGLIKAKDSLPNRLLLGRIAVRELFQLVKLSNPWLIKNYLRAGKYLLEDKRSQKEIAFAPTTVSLDTLNLQLEAE